MGSISVEDVSKKYKQYANRWARVANSFSGGRYYTPQEKWVLNNINFSVKSGEAIGIIGQNGSGKSTLLKLITGITNPSRGRIDVTGNVAALLELGMGFNPELTGRQNAQMALQLRGFDNQTIQRWMPDILEFAEIDSYFDLPLRTYSSGMQVRLAFSAATVIRPDILIVDEALSVGDVYFQHKSIARIREFKKKGTTLFFVSHDAATVKTLCNRAILLEKGHLTLDDIPDNVFNYYNAVIAQKEKDQEIKRLESNQKKSMTRSGNRKATIEKVELFNSQGDSSRAFKVGETGLIRCQIAYKSDIKNATFGMVIRDRLGNDIFGTNTFYLNHTLTTPGLIEVEFKVQFNLGYGDYSITVASHSMQNHIEDNHDWWDNSLIFQIIPKDSHYFVGVSFLPVEVYSKQLMHEGSEHG
ncbi:MAG: ABC transporter ATP-binding protein [Gammaproteobacteria bacterium]|nr:ABC transporter ATP-binding protein [Gammaproteobacteria bacterium]